MLRYTKIPALLLVIFSLYPSVAAWYYWHSGLYEGKIQVIEAEPHVIANFTFFFFLIFLKYFLYEISVRRNARKGSSLLWSLFLLSYSLAITVDIFSLYAGSQPNVAAGFAVISMVTISPAILLTGIALIYSLKFWRKKNRKSSAAI